VEEKEKPKEKRVRVSVLIPCYNRAGYIGQVVHSMMAQTRPPDEIIVADDASTDESVEVLSQLPVLLLRHEHNQGPATARNTALEAASGDIVLYIDADAYAEAHLIEVLLHAYQQFHCGPIGGIGGRGIESRIHTVYDRWRVLHARQDFGPRPRRDVPYLFGLCASYRRDALLQIGGFDPFFPINAGEDADVGYRLTRAGYRLHYTPDAIVYHQHVDTAESIKRVQYNWFYWTYLAKKRTGFHPWTLFAGTLRRLFMDTAADLLLRRDRDLARLDIDMFCVKMKALLEASRRKPTA
jgi:glycosyltransferase involved in cell wall biosynthesis